MLLRTDSLVICPDDPGRLARARRSALLTGASHASDREHYGVLAFIIELCVFFVSVLYIYVARDEAAPGSGSCSSPAVCEDRCAATDDPARSRVLATWAFSTPRRAAIRLYSFRGRRASFLLDERRAGCRKKLLAWACVGRLLERG